MLIHWLWLATRPDLSDRAKAALLEHFPDAEDLYFADPENFRELSEEAQKSLQDKNLTQAQKILEECAQKDIHILAYRDAGYPMRLRNIPDPPVVLYYKGRLPDFDGMPLVGVVGTRKASAYGLTAAKRMGYQIASCGGIVVSGMAFGIDGLAMAGALTAGKPVIGVLGCGADIVYPASNKALFADTQKNGCILTEFPPGTPPNKWNFPKRNRIISGISCGVLVVEAPEKSGALITARQAADQGRDVFVVPGNIDVDSCKGSNALLRDGAIAATCGWDVIGEYEGLFPDKIHKQDKPVKMTVYPEEMKEPEKAKVAQKPKLLEKLKKAKPKEEPPAPKLPEAKFSEQEAALVAMIQKGTDLVDDIIAQSGLPAAQVSASLTMLAIKGVIKNLPGKRVALQSEKK